ncbi:amidohydrolase [Sphingosinicella sp. CPCC 101087]|uniref:amidohydrolase n=1 Tax=Sphingosinicella sp. CPCC 101087 TaxID=2497754 RepID=UPI00101E0439|nr:amidohydrolase [Sphingosinicella sp. CPCC 101087]
MKRVAAILLLTAACAAGAQPPPERADATAPDPFPSTYRRAPGAPMAITGAHILTGTGAELVNGTILVRDGLVEAVGEDLAVPEGYEVVDASGRWLTPGLIDAHSHLGVSSSPTTPLSADHNEGTSPNTAEVWAEHAVWPQDPQFRLARAGGVTTLMILPGSGNLIGGRSVTLRNVPSPTVQGMKFPGAPYGVKMACGENPKRSYGARGRSPATRMGNVALFRRAWIEAADYARRLDRAGSGGEPPRRDLQLETLAGVLDGEILVQNHCYRADEMAIMIDMGREFGFRIRAFHHATEAYKIAPMLAREDICVATWASSWGSKMEALDSVEENAPMIEAAGGCAIIHSDDATLGQRLNQEAGIALAAGRRAGIDVTDGEAIRWITANPARALGIDDRVGTLEPGRMADLVLWSANPFSVYALAERVWIDGAPVWDRSDPRYQAPSDFLLGQPGQASPR